MNDWLLLLVALFLVLLNGFFVAAEFSIVKLRTTQADALASLHGTFGRTLKNVRTNLDAYLSACQLGITLASLGLGWIGEPAVAHLIEGPLATLGVESPRLRHGISFALAFGLITFLHIVLGELAPKSMAIRNTSAVSLWTATPLYLFHWLMYPFIRLLNGSANMLLARLGVETQADGEEAHSAQEIKQVLLASHRHGELAQREASWLLNALEISELTAGDLMKPWSDAIVLDTARPVEEAVRLAARYRYSRYPVCEDGRENPVGLLLFKDLFAAMQERPSIGNISELMRDIPVAAKDDDAAALFQRFLRGHPHFAVVVDRRGGPLGFVTFDHVLDVLFGRVQDEFRRAREGWRACSDGSFEGRGTLPIFTLERLAGRDIESGDVDSVSGLLMLLLDRVPRSGDSATINGLRIEVIEMDGTRVGRVRVWIDPTAPGLPA